MGKSKVMILKQFSLDFNKFGRLKTLKKIKKSETSKKKFRQQRADKKVFFVDSEYRADLKIFYIDSAYRAGWKKDSKKELLD